MNEQYILLPGIVICVAPFEEPGKNKFASLNNENKERSEFINKEWDSWTTHRWYNYFLKVPNLVKHFLLGN